MILNDLGTIIKQQWIWLNERYPYLVLDEYVIMPNHFHGIINIDLSVGKDYLYSVGKSRDSSLQYIYRNPSLRQSKIKSISELIGAFKTTSSKLIHNMGYPEFK